MIYLNLGRREMGKTTLAYYLIHRQPVRVIFDPRGQFPGTRRITTQAELTDAFDRLYETDARSTLNGVETEIVVTPDRRPQTLFESTAREVKRWIQSNKEIAFLVDEVSLIDPESTDEFDEFDWILRLCPRRQAIVVLTAHRPMDVPTNIRAISDFWCVFQMTQEHDLKVIDKRCSPDVAAMLPKLQPFQFIVWDEAHGKARTVRNAASWFVRMGHGSGGHMVRTPTLDGEPLMKNALSLDFDER